MITFPCHCGKSLEVPEELAGGLIQCPDCGKLNDVPTLDDLSHLRDDGTLELVDEEPARPDPGQLARFVRYYGPKHDERGEEIDLRPTPEEIARAGAETAQQAVRVAPRYDPETGQLIRPLEVKQDPTQAAGPIPVAKAALTYSTDRVMHRLSPGRILLELLMPVNALVMTFVYVAHVMIQALASIAAGVILPVAFLLMCAAVPLIVFILSHYGNVVEDIGPDGRDELPRPLRNVNLWEDLWAPFGRMVLGLGLAFGPVLAVYLGQWAPEGMRLPAMWTLGVAGIIVLPALLITTLTSGTILNLRPDRVLGVMRACRGGYIAAVIGSFLACPLYLWTLFGLFLVSDATYRANPWLRHLDHPAITYCGMLLAVYFGHWLCWQLGMLYRRHHEQFPWVLQRHIPTPRDRRPPMPGAAATRDAPAGPAQHSLPSQGP